MRAMKELRVDKVCIGSDDSVHYICVFSDGSVKEIGKVELLKDVYNNRVENAKLVKGSNNLYELRIENIGR